MSYTFLDLAKERYSVRKFTEQQIEQEKLDKILILPTCKSGHKARHAA